MFSSSFYCNPAMPTFFAACSRFHHNKAPHRNNTSSTFHTFSQNRFRTVKTFETDCIALYLGHMYAEQVMVQITMNGISLVGCNLLSCVTSENWSLETAESSKFELLTPLGDTTSRLPFLGWISFIYSPCVHGCSFFERYSLARVLWARKYCVRCVNYMGYEVC